MTKSLFVFAGDVSADRHTGKLLAELKRLVPDVSIWGCGGSHMRAVGVEILHDLEQFGVFGPIASLRAMPFFVRLRKELTQQIKERRPDAVLLVDFSGFNLKLAQSLREADNELPILYFISPQIWASRPWRMKTIAKYISKMLVIFPFEEALYRNVGLDAIFVGHPLAKSWTAPSTTANKQKENWCRQLNLDPLRPIIGILPGSRRREITDLMPVVLQSIGWLQRLRPEVQFVISQANEMLAQDIENRFGRKLLKLQKGMKKQRSGGFRGGTRSATGVTAEAAKDEAAGAFINGCNVALAPVGENQQVMAHCDILWAKSGTSTLEGALAAKPMLILYRGDWVGYLLFLILKRVAYVGWPNLLAGFEVAPELLQIDCSAEQLVRRSLDLLDVPGLRVQIVQELSKIKDMLGSAEFPKVAAQEVCKSLG